MEGEEAPEPLCSNNDAPAQVFPTLVWVLRVETPCRLWVKEPFSPVLFSLALAAPLDRDDLAHCLGQTGLLPEVQAHLMGPLGDWSDGAFRIQVDDPANGRPGIVICRSIRGTSSLLLAASPLEAPACPPNGSSLPAATIRRRRGFGRTIV